MTSHQVTTSQVSQAARDARVRPQVTITVTRSPFETVLGDLQVLSVRYCPEP